MSTELGGVDPPRPPVPSRPAPAVPTRPAPARPPSAEPAWTPLKASSGPAPAKKRPVIEVLSAKPMSEVGFRDAKPSAGPDRKSLPPPPKRPDGVPSRPKSMMVPSVPGKPPRPASLVHSNPDTAELISFEPAAFENNAFSDALVAPDPKSPSLIDFDNESVTSTGSSGIYPDLLASLNSQPDIATSHQKEEEEEEPARAPPPRPSMAMSQLAAVMTQATRRPPSDDEDDEKDDDEWGVDAPSAAPGPALHNRPLPVLPGRPPASMNKVVSSAPLLPSAPAPSERPLPSAPAPSERPLPSAPAPSERPLPPAPKDRPLPSVPPPGSRPLPGIPPPSRPPAIPSRSNIPAETQPVSNDNPEENEVPAKESVSKPPRNAAMAQLAAIMTKRASNETNATHQTEEDDNKEVESLTNLMQSPAQSNFQDSFYSENEQSICEEEKKEEEISKASPRNPALSSLASVFNSAPQKPLSKPAPASKPRPPTPTKPKPSLKPKPATKPKPGVLPKPSGAHGSMKTSSSAMANLAAVMKGENPDASKNEEPVQASQISPRLPKSQSDYTGFAQAESPPTETDKNTDESQNVTSHTKSSFRLSAVHQRFGAPWMKQEEQDNEINERRNTGESNVNVKPKHEDVTKQHQSEAAEAPPKVFKKPGPVAMKPSWMKPKEKETSDSNEESDTPVTKEPEEPSFLPRKPGPAPMRATYRPTIIKPTMKPKVESEPVTKQDDSEQNNNKEEPTVGKLNKRATSMFDLDNKTENITQPDKKEAATEEVQMRPKKRPTIIRPPSMQNISTPAPAPPEDEDEKRPEPRPIPRDRPRPTPRSRMSAAISMPNLAQDMDAMSLQTIDFDDAPKKEPPKKPPPPKAAPPSRPRPPSFHGNLGASSRAGGSMMNLSTTSSSMGSKEAAPGKKPPRPASGPPPRPSSGPRRASVGGNVAGQASVPGLPPSLPNRPTPGHPLYHYVVSGPHAIAVYDYEATQEGDLSFKAGDVIQLKRRVDEEWLEGSSGDVSGMFPAGFVDVIEPPPQEAAASGPAHHPAPLEPAPSSQPAPSTMTGPRCVARYDYEGEEAAGDLSFRAGDTIRLLALEGDDWLKGELGGQQGIFPLTFVEIIQELPRETVMAAAPDEDHSQQHQESQEDVGDSVESGNIVTGLYDYTGEEGDLSFSAGDKIRVLSQVSPEWLYGQLGEYKGQFPVTFIDHTPSNLPPYQPEEKQEEQPKQDTLGTKASLVDSTETLGTCTAMFPYPGGSEEDLAFPQGAVITILEHIDDDWMKGELDGKTGIFPKAFVQVGEQSGTGSAPPDAPSKTPSGEAVAQYDFPAPSDGDLAFQVGDVITLLESVDADWMRGELNGQQGMFPANFVTVTKPIE